MKVTDWRAYCRTSGFSLNHVQSSDGGRKTALALPTLLPGNVFSVRVTGYCGLSTPYRFATGLTNWTDSLTMNAPSDLFYLQDTHATNAEPPSIG